MFPIQTASDSRIGIACIYASFRKHARTTRWHVLFTTGPCDVAMRMLLDDAREPCCNPLASLRHLEVSRAKPAGHRGVMPGRSSCRRYCFDLPTAAACLVHQQLRSQPLQKTSDTLGYVASLPARDAACTSPCI